MKSISDTLKFIISAHKGQKYGKVDYWHHPVEVAEEASMIFYHFPGESYVAALLHDVVEDTKYTLDDLREMGQSDAVIEIVGLCTKDPSLSYEENIQRIIDSGNIEAMKVKFADNSCNYRGDKSDWTEKRREKSQKKYKASMYKLVIAMTDITRKDGKNGQLFL